MFTPTRDEARRFFIDAWAKYRAGAPIEGLEKTAVAIVAASAAIRSPTNGPKPSPAATARYATGG